MQVLCGLCRLFCGILCLITAICCRSQCLPCRRCPCRVRPCILHLCHTAATGILRKYRNGQLIVSRVRSGTAAAAKRHGRFFTIYFSHLNGLGYHIPIGIRQRDSIASIFRDIQIDLATGGCNTLLYFLWSVKGKLSPCALGTRILHHDIFTRFPHIGCIR